MIIQVNDSNKNVNEVLKVHWKKSLFAVLHTVFMLFHTITMLLNQTLDIVQTCPDRMLT